MVFPQKCNAESVAGKATLRRSLHGMGGLLQVCVVWQGWQKRLFTTTLTMKTLDLIRRFDKSLINREL
jgi:hypothetical protein